MTLNMPRNGYNISIVRAHGLSGLRHWGGSGRGCYQLQTRGSTTKSRYRSNNKKSDIKCSISHLHRACSWGKLVLGELEPKINGLRSFVPIHVHYIGLSMAIPHFLRAKFLMQPRSRVGPWTNYLWISLRLGGWFCLDDSGSCYVVFLGP